MSTLWWYRRSSNKYLTDQKLIDGNFISKKIKLTQKSEIFKSVVFGSVYPYMKDIKE